MWDRCEPGARPCPRLRVEPDFVTDIATGVARGMEVTVILPLLGGFADNRPGEGGRSAPGPLLVPNVVRDEALFVDSPNLVRLDVELLFDILDVDRIAGVGPAILLVVGA